MDDFFNSVASLMSDLLRRCIQRSLDDLIAMMHLYKDGNNYKGEYHILRDLAVAKLKQPSTIFLVSILISAFESIRMNNYVTFCQKWCTLSSHFCSVQISAMR